MKRQEIKELHSQSKKQLFALQRKVQAELVKLRAELAAGKLKDVHQLKKKRRDLARIKTIISEKELAASTAQETK